VAKYDPQANIWLLEQGAVFTLPRSEAKTQKEEEEKERKEIETGGRLPEGAQGEAQADEILSAYIKDGKYQLTLIDKQIKWFYYYQMRAEDKPKFQGFDSGLLEEKPTTEGEVTYNKKPASAPRDIYSVYKDKTPKS
jgi:hypothetical protein